ESVSGVYDDEVVGENRHAAGSQPGQRRALADTLAAADRDRCAFDEDRSGVERRVSAPPGEDRQRRRPDRVNDRLRARQLRQNHGGRARTAQHLDVDLTRYRDPNALFLDLNGRLGDLALSPRKADLLSVLSDGDEPRKSDRL